MTVSRELEMERRRRALAEQALRNAEAEREEELKQEALARRSAMTEAEVAAEVRAEEHRQKAEHHAVQPQVREGTVAGAGYKTPTRQKAEPAPVPENKIEVFREEDLRNKSRTELVALAEEWGVEVRRLDGKKKPPTKLDYIAALCS